jgi:hypothetical protein
MVKNENYITIQGWMVNELGLKGNSLIIYATIYGFSQTNGCEFTGSANYLAEWCGCSRQTVMTTLNKLVANDLIIKTEKFKNNVKFCSYGVNLTGGCQNSLQGDVKKFDRGMSKNLTGGCQNSLHNNIDINNRNKNIEDNIDKKNSKKKSKIDTKIESIEKKCLEYDLEDESIELLSRFFRNLLENHKMVTDDKVNAILMKLAKVNTKTQINAIQLSLDNGYMNIDPEWLQNKNNSYNGNGKCSKELAWRTHEEMEEAEKERQEFFEKVKNNDPSIHHF